MPALAARLIPSRNDGCTCSKSVKLAFPLGNCKARVINVANSARVTRRYGKYLPFPSPCIMPLAAN